MSTPTAPTTPTTLTPAALTTGSRLQLAIDVDDRASAVDFYTRLLGVGPAKQRSGYANFAVADPPLKLVLLENPGRGGGLNHLGVEVADAAAVDAARARADEAGLAVRRSRDEVCCYARQDKFWVDDAPDGVVWEVYTVLADAERMHPDTMPPDADPGARP